MSTLDHELLKPNSSVALHKHSNALVDVLPPEADSSIAMLTAEEKPDVSYSGKAKEQSLALNLSLKPPSLILSYFHTQILAVWIFRNRR